MKRLGLAALLATGCVPADRALPLGSVSFHVRATDRTREGFDASGYRVVTDRALLSFKSMTIGKADDPERCSYRGRGALGDVLFDVRDGNVQTFNGVLPSDCPDVGVVLGPPDDATVPGPGIKPLDIATFLSGATAHAIVELTARRDDAAYRVLLRFDTATTSSRFGGCRSGTRGVRIKPNARLEMAVAFGVETFFREGFGQGAALSFEPFRLADDLGDGDHVITMKELDALPLTAARGVANHDLYKIDGTAVGFSFGAYVREQFKSVFVFGPNDEPSLDGFCSGNAPGVE